MTKKLESIASNLAGIKRAASLELLGGLVSMATHSWYPIAAAAIYTGYVHLQVFKTRETLPENIQEVVNNFGQAGLLIALGGGISFASNDIAPLLAGTLIGGYFYICGAQASERVEDSILK